MLEAASVTSVDQSEERKVLIVFCISRFFSLLSDQLLLFAIPVLVFKVSGSISYSGIAFIIEWLPRVVFLPFLGILVDRFSSKSQVLTVDIARAILIVSTLLSNNIFTVMALAGILSLLGGYAFLVLENVIARHFGSIGLSESQSKLQMVDQVTRALGPPLASTLMFYFNFSALIWVAFVMVVTSLTLISLRLRFPDKQREIVHKENVSFSLAAILGNLKIASLTIGRSRILRSLILLSMLVNFSEGVCLALLPAIILKQYQASQNLLGLLAGGAAVTSFLALGVVPFLARKFGSGFLGLCGGSAMVCLGLILGLYDNLVVFSTAYILFIVARSYFALYARAERLKHIPQEHLGKTLGIFIAFLMASLPLSGLMLPLFDGRLSAQGIIFLANVMAISLALPGAVYLLRYNLGRIRA
ncbi:MAG TPA: MFS transporter [Dongiaceae bacterium]|jgi:hypothetical protein|nr:MFS transporter [Dongiaceae bacterium]